MPIRYRIDRNRRLIRVEVVGDFSSTDTIETIDNIIRDPDFEPGFKVLSDHSAIGEPITAEQTRRLVDHFGSRSDVLAGTRCAIVATKPASYGMMRMLSVLAEEVPMAVEVFPSREEAEKWLGVAD